MKLRKMMGSVEDIPVVRLMALIETQSKLTLTQWAVEYTADRYLPMLGQCRTAKRSAAAVEAVRSHLRGELPLKEVRPLLSDARKAAQEEQNPVRQAAARALSTACGTLTTPSNALGFAFYGAAAYAYHSAGTEATRELQDDLAQEELERILGSLQAVAVQNETNPVRISWNC